MITKNSLWIQFVKASLPCFLMELAGAFRVDVPHRDLLGVLGRPALLECIYTASQDARLDDLIVTWQRTSDLAVMHSFYHGKDQLDTQDNSFRKRTQLFPGELLAGNVSLLLDEVRASDKGQYQCSVSSSRGTGKAQLQLKFAAFYTEPQFTIRVRLSNVTFGYESRGYPVPEVGWADPEGQNLSSQAVLNLLEGSDGLITMQTHLVLTPVKEANYTFTMRNQLLGQVIRRPVVFSYDGLGYCEDNLVHQRIHICLIAVIVFMIVLIVGILVKRPACRVA